MKGPSGNSKGFTLIELIIIISILGLLAAISIPAYLSARGKAQDAAALETLGEVRRSLELFFADKGYYPPNITTVVDLSTALGANWPANVKTDGIAGSIVSADTDAAGSVFRIYAMGRDAVHFFGIRQDETKAGPDTLVNCRNLLNN